MARTRSQNPLGIQSPLQQLSNARVARPRQAPPSPQGPIYLPGIQFFYDPNVGRYDDDISLLSLNGSVRAPSDVSAGAGPPSVASDGGVYHENEEDDDDIKIVREVVVISDDEENDNETSELELGEEIVAAVPSSDADPDRTISLSPSSHPNTPSNHSNSKSDPDRTNSESASPPLHPAYEDEEDDRIVDFQQDDLPLYNNPAPSHFERLYRGVRTIWSVDEWAEQGERVLAEEAAERARETLQGRRWANVGGRSRLSRRRAWRRRQSGAEPRERMNGRFS
ncbi:uncharacterized protein RSE6_04856 [Rhynchosporium secalis]|uniref:Uncharacterized protein n=1 Tax=Rhynchosporium secalis TaxID=38038 RepID=A0A1E1M6B9_RHYSE|nr:uncharacterized protein RSE6_04856 [Rhynchosporium secalis]